jgi:hypothetical protein
VNKTSTTTSTDTNSVSQDTDNTLYDKAGIWISSICAFHCLALPVLLPMVPLIASSFFAEVWFERMILSISILIGFIGLFIGFYKYHRQLYPLYSLTMGGLIYWHKDVFGHEYEPFTIAVGALLIVVAHYINIKLCRSCNSCQADSCASSVAS